jgi:predicted acyl esterase
MLDWMDRYVRGDEKAPAAVRDFVMGAHRWKTASSWPPPGREQLYYLSPGTGSRGALADAPPTADASTSAFRSAFFPNFSRNLHTGESETVSSRMQTATIRVHHDRERPSQITLHVAGR